VALKAVLNKGLSLDLSKAFPNIIPISRPEVSISKIINPFWLAGFVEAEGCFSVTIFKSKTSKFGEAVKLSFILTQNVRDEDLMKSLIEYLGCGYTTLENRGTIDFKVLCVNLDPPVGGGSPLGRHRFTYKTCRARNQNFQYKRCYCPEGSPLPPAALAAAGVFLTNIPYKVLNLKIFLISAKQ
jgi:hypothetical protein